MAEKDTEEEFVSEPDQFLDHEGETKLEHDIKVMAGEEEVDVYNHEGREDLVKDDEIEPWEEGFLEGAEGRGHFGVCAHCKQVLSDDHEEIVEREYHGQVLRFCSDKCAQAGPHQ